MTFWKKNSWHSEGKSIKGHNIKQQKTIKRIEQELAFIKYKTLRQYYINETTKYGTHTILKSLAVYSKKLKLEH